MCTTSGRGQWHDKIYHFHPDQPPSSDGDELQSEFFIRFEDLVPALGRLEQLAPLVGDWVQIMELRPVAADNFLMSPAFGRKVIGLHFTWFKDQAKVLESVRVVQARLGDLIVAVHWGKLFSLGKTEIRRLYGGRLARFKRLRRRMDPEGKFVNAYFEETFGSGFQAKL